jgi:hypothetical protein
MSNATTTEGCGFYVVRDTRVEIPATRFAPTDCSTLSFSSSAARHAFPPAERENQNPISAADERRSAIQQTAPQEDWPSGRFRVIHPFHPLYQQQLDEVGRTRRWGDERVWFRTTSGDLRTIPLRFTSLAAPDPYRQWGGGRSWHRVAELIELRRLMDALRDPEVGNV